MDRFTKMINIQKNKRVLVIGASGMLGNAVLRLFSQSPGYDVLGTVRSFSAQHLLPNDLQANLISAIDVENIENLISLFTIARPDIVINCIGLIKQLINVDDPLTTISINSLLPHQLARLCAVAGARFVHMSTDCVFSGERCMYTEADNADAKDLYGRSKFLGEVDYPHAITLRTSIIGHELDSARSLIGWFLAQEDGVKGYKRAIFSGLPTVEIARIIRDCVIPHPELHGLYHVSAEPINKFELLKLVAEAYGKTIDICADDQIVINRSLDSTRFRQATGFLPQSWPELIRTMREFG
jgi:dTDP-4-dehydrorhamnose reductase